MFLKKRTLFAAQHDIEEIAAVDQVERSETCLFALARVCIWRSCATHF